MDLNRLRTLLADPVASLFLVLTLCVFVARRPVSAGVHLPIAQVRVIPFGQCFSGLSGRDIVLRIKNDGSTWINETEFSPADIRESLSAIYEYRQEKIAYLMVEPEVDDAEFAHIYALAASSTPGLHLGVLTRQLLDQVEKCPFESGCTIDWPFDRGNIYCRNPIPLTRIPRSPVKPHRPS